MNNKEFIAALAARTQLTAEQAQQWLDATCEVITQQLLEQQAITLQGFGTFETKIKMERISVQPNTSKRTLVPPKQVVVFKPSTTLKERYK